MAEELADRFGPIPDPLDHLLYQLRVKVLAMRANVASITTESAQLRLRVPNLEQINRVRLQRYLGHHARVSRTAIWLPLDEGTNAWRVTLVQVLERLAGYWLAEGTAVQARTVETR